MLKGLLRVLLYCGLLLCPGGAALAQADQPLPEDETQAEASADGDESAEQSDGVAEQSDDLSEQELADQRRSQLAQQDAANRVAREIDGVLNEQGLMPRRNKAGVSMHDKLVELSTRAGLLLRSTTSPLARFTLLQTQARVYSALAQDAIARGDELEFTRRLRQLRSSGTTLRGVDLPFAESSGAYWVLLADLADMNQTDAPVETRQQLAREVLEQYIETYADDEAAEDFVIDARLALARLHDQAGNQPEVAKQLDKISGLDAQDPRAMEWAGLKESVARVGQAVDLDTRTTRGLRWQLEDNLSGPVLVHFYADGSLGSAAMIDGLMEKIARSSRGGYTVVSFRVGPPAAQAKLPAWPTLVAESSEQERELLAKFGIRSTPTLVWIDTDGTIAAVGQTLDVFDRLVQNQLPPRRPGPRPAGDSEASDGPGAGGSSEPEAEDSVQNE